MRNLIARTLPVALSASLALSACHGSAGPPRDPATVTNTNGVVTTSGGPAEPGDPSGVSPDVYGTRPASSGPAVPLEGDCDRGEPSREAKDLQSCLKSCRGLSDQVPLGSSCTPAANQCRDRCGEIYMR